MFMRELFFFISLLMLGISGPLAAFNLYVKNETNNPVIANGTRVNAQSTTVVGTYESYEPDDQVYLEFSAKSLNHELKKGCSLHFRTYSGLKGETLRFETTIIVLERSDHLVCLPRAVEFKTDGTPKENGSILTIPQAKRLVTPSSTLRQSTTYIPLPQMSTLKPYAYPWVHKHIQPRGSHLPKYRYLPSPKQPY